MSGTFARAAVGAVLAATLALAGCGQKGPLYLPDKGGAVVTTPATATPGPPPAPTAPGQPPEPSPVPQPQSTAEPPPADTTAPAKKPDKDEDPPR